MTVADEYLGPSVELIEFWSFAQQAPMYGHDDRAEGLAERVLAVQDVVDLEPGDRAFLEECHAQVNAGLSPTLQWYPGGDWPSEDAELDGAERAAPVTAVNPAPATAEAKSLFGDDDSIAEDGTELDELDEGAWIGL